MPTKVHILTPGFTSPNGRAFLFPLVHFSRAIHDAGITIRFFNQVSPGLTECDTLILDSKFFHHAWGDKKQRTMAWFAEIREQTGRFLFFDIGDSSGWLIDGALPFVDGYFKAQLLRDRTAYARPMYGHRPYTDFAHRQFGVTDTVPVGQTPQVLDPEILNKLHVSWNSGLADYSRHGPLRMAAYHHLPLRALLRDPAPWTSPHRERSKALSCRMGINYPRATIRWQREQIASRLKTRLDTEKLSRAAYIAELASSRVVVSPFGLGEITLKDFEVFLSGAALLKPEMDHMETWPNLFESGVTMFSHRWDLEDLETQIQKILDMPSLAVAVAEQGQDRYRRHLAGPDSASLFAERFSSIVCSTSERKTAA